MKGIVLFLAVAATALIFSNAAFANSVTCAHSATCHSGNLGGPSSRASGDGTLPFTGLDLAGIAGAGGLLLVAGFSLQRASRRRR